MKFIDGKKGYSIPYVSKINGNEKKIVIINHGFGSSKSSPIAQMLLEKMPNYKIGVISFDFPAHGDSPVDTEKLSIENCISDLESIEKYVQSIAPSTELCYFSSSFGAYINLQFLSTKEHKGKLSFLRSAAVNMPELFNHPTPEQSNQIKSTGFLNLPFDKPLKLTPTFIADLQAHNLFEIYKPGFTKVQMIHGENDVTINPKKAQDFAKKFNIDITMVPNGGHRLMKAKQPKMVFDLALKMFLAPSQ